ncbi:MAG: TraR/DksA family transcriptional regulator [Acidimicrobiales bacterium]
MPSNSATAVQYVDDDFLLRQRRELGARRASYREQVQRLSVAVDELAQASEAPDLGDEQGFAEADSLNVERDRVVSLTALARGRIDEVDAALRRLESGTYGACRTCRRAIPVVRLEAVPEATQCVSCASGSVLRRR